MTKQNCLIIASTEKRRPTNTIKSTEKKIVADTTKILKLQIEQRLKQVRTAANFSIAPNSSWMEIYRPLLAVTVQAQYDAKVIYTQHASHMS